MKHWFEPLDHIYLGPDEKDGKMICSRCHGLINQLDETQANTCEPMIVDNWYHPYIHLQRR